MSGYKGHITGAAVFCAAYLMVLNSLSASPAQFSQQAILSADWMKIAGLFVLAILFGLWPDVDTNSKGQDVFYSGIFILDLVLIFSHQLEAAAYLGLLAITPILGKHRGWTHTWAAMLIVPLPILLVPYLYDPDRWQYALAYYGAAVAGYLSHLVLDGLIVPWIRVRGAE